MHAMLFPMQLTVQMAVIVVVGVLLYFGWIAGILH